jgi:midasin (ATPase involved in ribosome maturation)
MHWKDLTDSFLAMPPGKRELPAALRNRFTEVYLAEPGSREDLRAMVAAYLRDTVPNPPADAVVDFYLAAKAEAVRHAVNLWKPGAAGPLNL